MTRPKKQLRDLGIPVPKPPMEVWNEDPHDLSGAEVKTDVAPHVIGPASKQIRYESLMRKRGRTRERSGNQAIGLRPYERRDYVVLASLTDQDRIFLFVISGDTVSSEERINRVLIDLESPTDEQQEAVEQFGRHLADSLMR